MPRLGITILQRYYCRPPPLPLNGGRPTDASFFPPDWEQKKLLWRTAGVGRPLTLAFAPDRRREPPRGLLKNGGFFFFSFFQNQGLLGRRRRRSQNGHTRRRRHFCVSISRLGGGGGGVVAKKMVPRREKTHLHPLLVISLALSFFPPPF